MYKRATMYSKKRNYLSRQGCMGNTKGSSPLDALPRMLLERFCCSVAMLLVPEPSLTPCLRWGLPGAVSQLDCAQSKVLHHRIKRSAISQAKLVCTSLWPPGDVSDLILSGF